MPFFLRSSAIALLLGLSIQVPQAIAAPATTVLASSSNTSEPSAEEAAMYVAELKTLEKQRENCKPTIKNKDSVAYRICIKSSRVLSAAEAGIESGDGIEYLWSGDRFRALRFFHQDEVWFFQNGQLEAILTQDGSKSKLRYVPTPAERKHAKHLVPNGYRKILRIFGRR